MTPGPLMLIALLGAHYYFDYAGQGDFMAKAKNPMAPIPGVPWRQVLTAHAVIHGAAAALITGLWPVFLGEAFIHWMTDGVKCRGAISYTTDQTIHVVSKFVWFGLAVWVSL